MIQPFHLAIPVQNLEKCRTFYRDILLCKEGRSSEHWVDFNFFGHQFVIHQKDGFSAEKISNPVDGHDVPVPHFGVILSWEDWHNLADRLKALNTQFVIEPTIRFKGKIGEQATMFFNDPENNALEFKAFKRYESDFCKIMQLIVSHKVPKLTKPIRLQDYAVGIFATNSTKSGIKKAIKKGFVFVDGKIATTGLYINGNETIELFEYIKTRKEFDFPLEILFEDDFLAIIYKPAGILVSGNSFATIHNALTQNLKPSSQKDAVRPRPIHRLDYPTSGLLLIGKTNSAIIYLNKLFENKEIQKTYHAITIGKMNVSGIINFPVDEKESFTEYHVLKTVKSERFNLLNLVKLTPKTGRRHQLRKHLSTIGNPILGDQEYFLEGLILKGKGLYLNASSLEFTHPKTQEKISITKELPKKFKKIFH